MLPIVAFCDGCGEPFTPRRANATRCGCSRDHGDRATRHDARTRQRAEHDLEFIGVDGEGITHDGNHDYCLLTVGDQSLHRGGARLSALEIFAFLWEQFAAHPRACFVGFYLGYDFAQWLRDLPENRARALLSPEGIARRRRTVRAHLPPWPVDFEPWQLDILPMRRFKLRPSGEPPPTAQAALVNRIRQDDGTVERRWRWLTICDVGPFFQSSFLKAIDPSAAVEPICTATEFATIKAGKERRSVAAFDPAMIRYNALECDVLARLMDQQNRGLVSEGIRLRRNQWIGPGQAAQQWLANIEAPTGELIRECVPAEFRDAAAAAYFGGWFEIFWHGPVPGECWSYDINSAYPHVMSGLPCLLHGRYRGLRALPRADDSAGVLVRAALSGNHPSVGSALHRSPTGKVLRPRETAGWYWLNELRAAERAGFTRILTARDVLRYEPCGCAPPLAAIADLYQGRLRVGKNTPAGRAKRLIYNSAYGKHAQSVGDPKFANPVTTSLITAGTRTMILDAIASHPNGARDLLMVATDSVTFRTRHPGLALDAAELGKWTESRHDNLSLFMPGVYWDDETRNNLAAPKLKSRGINARDLAARLDHLDGAWQRFGRDGWPRLVLPVQFQMVSPRQALARNAWELCGSVVTDGRRTISADPIAKRVANGPGRSRPYQRVEGEPASAPYRGSFGDEARALAELEFGVHPDGPIGTLLGELI